MRDSFNKYYMPLIEIKDFNALIKNKPFFDQSVMKKCQETMIIQQEIYQIICIIKNNVNSLAQIYQDKPNTSIPQQINFVEKLEEDDGVTMFFIAEKKQNNILDFSLDPLIVTELYK